MDGGAVLFSSDDAGGGKRRPAATRVERVQAIGFTMKVTRKLEVLSRLLTLTLTLTLTASNAAEMALAGHSVESAAILPRPAKDGFHSVTSRHRRRWRVGSGVVVFGKCSRSHG